MSLYRPDSLEGEVLAVWEKEGTFASSLRQREGRERFSFYDGPPYATGLPHYGHLLQTTVKDAVTRYWTMRGFRTDRRVGWDCHGLPVENMVERELGITTKKEIEEGGVEAFNAACRAAVVRHVDEWTALLRRMGRWADYTRAYLTMDASFIESAWWVCKVVWDRGLLYKGRRSGPYCPRCATPLSHHETALGYRDVTDPAVTVKIRLTDEEQTFLLVWTTTPWTLPGNAAVAVKPDLRYARVRVGDERWIVAKDRVAEVVQEEHVVEDEFSGSALVGRTYEPLYAFMEPEEPFDGARGTPAYRVVAAPFVSAAEGTGLVHIAPAFGEEDFSLAEEEGLPVIETVDEQGRFLPAVRPWAGRFVKDADAAIIKDLEAQGALLGVAEIRHSYPHCWRCETPLIFRAVTSWFIAVTKIKEQLLKNAEQITWVPSHLKEGRFGQGLRDAPDWAVSRTRYWGIPLPVWECAACGRPTVVGSLTELEAAGGDRSVLKSRHADPDLHRPYVDRVVLRCAHCGGEARRVPDVLDVWFDSGSMPYGQWHYPFENAGLVEEAFPADFIGEALEMTRGWFYTLHVLAGILTLEDVGLGVGKPAFRNVVASGLILAEDGRKLSKRFGNYPDPAGIIKKYGADTVRLYLLAATSFGEDLRFSDQLVGELYRRFTLILWNVWEFYRTYAASHSEGSRHGGTTKNPAERRVGPSPSAQDDRRPLLDRWILARTAKLAEEVREAMDSYHIDDAARALVPFVEDLSTWYVRRSRGRKEALPVLREVLRQFSLVAAPFIPFLAEHIHRELTERSPHLEDFPTSFPTSDVGQHPSSDVGVLDQMRVIRALAAAGHRARAEAKIKVRQPLEEIVFEGDASQLEVVGEEGVVLLREELNVKNVILRPLAAAEGSRREEASVPPPSPAIQQEADWIRVVEGGRTTTLTTALTDDLKAEGLVRELIRHVQDLRKQAGYRFDNVITLSIVTEEPTVRAAIERFMDLLKTETKSSAVRSERGAADAETTTEIAAAKLWIGVWRQ